MKPEPDKAKNPINPSAGKIDLEALKLRFSDVKGNALMDELLEAAEEYLSNSGRRIDAGKNRKKA